MINIKTNKPTSIVDERVIDLAKCLVSDESFQQRIGGYYYLVECYRFGSKEILRVYKAKENIATMVSSPKEALIYEEIETPDKIGGDF